LLLFPSFSKILRQRRNLRNFCPLLYETLLQL
jgi:hypothetical protein